MVPCFLHNKTGSSALLWVHGVSALCLGCQRAGKSVFVGEKTCCTLPAVAPSFLALTDGAPVIGLGVDG